eukprot:707886-Hanusia_phi.AAC.1
MPANSFATSTSFTLSVHNSQHRGGRGRWSGGGGRVAACSEYSLVDCGDLKRLEKFGETTVCRPCPSATWQVGRADLWKTVDLEFSTGSTGEGRGGGNW